MKGKKTFELLACAMFAALTAVLSQFSIPIGPVPINLATFSVFLAGGILGARGGLVSQMIYILLGAAGLPVFAGFSGGIGIIAGPTGGYIVGYAAAAWLIGLMTGLTGRRPFSLAVSMAVGMAVCYFLGTAWFMIVTKRALWESLTLCVFPFLVGDALKIAVAVVVSVRLSAVYGRLSHSAGAA
ncbi:biotin transporter BioY [Caproicibacter sp. BJN0012]|uniref:biotin transporter BioY n=1 Tax=Caproicibacter sp. BJN0012 TaxID=3110227 RepID=UPI002E12F73E